MEARATVIIPTYGNAPFARWAIKSVQQQTVKDIEICIICDGSPEQRVSFFKELAKEDGRIKVYTFPKSPRTGEPYRDIVIKETTGKIICYCSHDDLWLPYHIETLEETLKKCRFTHSINAYVNTPENIKDRKNIFKKVRWIDLENKTVVKKMHSGKGFFGLTCGAHRRDCYYELKEGWATTPREDIPTDLYMWCKFLDAFGEHCKTTKKITSLNFAMYIRKDWSEQNRSDELKDYFEKLQDPAFLRKIDEHSLKFRPFSLLKIKLYFYNKGRNFIKTIAP
jgi:GalNAc5-diNAcBac-PP-undecaprenol beta-1,3-glucosyltransferase